VGIAAVGCKEDIVDHKALVVAAVAAAAAWEAFPLVALASEAILLAAVASEAFVVPIEIA
jgi:hypothetical protein